MAPAVGAVEKVAPTKPAVKRHASQTAVGTEGRRDAQMEACICVSMLPHLYGSVFPVLRRKLLEVYSTGIRAARQPLHMHQDEGSTVQAAEPANRCVLLPTTMPAGAPRAPERRMRISWMYSAAEPGNSGLYMNTHFVLLSVWVQLMVYFMAVVVGTKLSKHLTEAEPGSSKLPEGASQMLILDMVEMG